MRRMVWIIAAAGLAVLAAMLTSCRGGDQLEPKATGGPHIVTVSPPPSEEVEDGGRTESSDPNAPKTIEDTRIIRFECWFSTLDDAEPGMLGSHIYSLTARLENGAVVGTYEIRDAGEKRLFRADHSFLEELDELVKQYDIPQFNGHSAEVSGLPGDYGARLDVRYASGESIYASDNESCFLPYTFLDALNRHFFSEASDNTGQALEYGTYYPLDSMTTFRMDWEEGDREAGTWTLTVNGVGYSKDFYGYAPQVWLLRRNRMSYLYLTVPAGDVSYHTRIYEVNSGGAAFLGEVAMALRADPAPIPTHMEMTLNDLIQCGPVIMVPHGSYRLGGNGLPEPADPICGLEGPWVALREGGRFNPDNRESAAVSGGMWTLVAGQAMRPYRTDRESFLDFLTDDERVVRFTIDKWSDEMQLDNFGTLADVFTADNG